VVIKSLDKLSAKSFINEFVDLDIVTISHFQKPQEIYLAVSL